MDPNREQLERLARMVASTRSDELHCDEIIDLVCGYFEADKHGAELTPEQREVARHLEQCPECTEVFRGLCDACNEEEA